MANIGVSLFVMSPFLFTSSRALWSTLAHQRPVLALIWLLFWFLVQVRLSPSPVIQFRCVRVFISIFSSEPSHVIFCPPSLPFLVISIGNITKLYVICVYLCIYLCITCLFDRSSVYFCLHHSYISLEILFSDYTNFCYAKHIIVVFSVGSPVP